MVDLEDLVERGLGLEPFACGSRAGLFVPDLVPDLCGVNGAGGPKLMG